jgi:hypothetical protein
MIVTGENQKKKKKMCSVGETCLLCCSYIYIYIYLFIYLFKTPSFATQFTNLYITSFGFSVKPASDLFVINSHINNLYLHMRMRSHSLT